MPEDKIIKNKIIIFSILSIIVIIFLISRPIQATELNLKDSYHCYKRDYMSNDGRILDPQRDNISTSEGQSYMLIRSVLMNDKHAFDLVLKWTIDNLQREDKLFSWLWGENADGEYKILDENSASDADIDIAFALILAHKKWHNKNYSEAASEIINSIWEKETKQIGEYLVLMPGALQVNSEIVEINPSYFSPYAFKLFKEYDKEHDWDKLVDSSYHYINLACETSEIGLPPDWIIVMNGEIKPGTTGRSAFSYDAIRVFPRVFLDYAITKDERALPVLEKSKFFITQWEKSKTVYTNYLPNGKPQNKTEFLGSIALLIPVINMFDEKIAKEIHDKKLVPYFNKKGFCTNKNDYYGRNLLWFGAYLYKNYKKVKG